MNALAADDGSGIDAVPGQVVARIVAANLDAAAIYADTLASQPGEGPRRYLNGRRLGWAVGHPRWRLGYAAPGWDHLTQALRRMGYSADDLLAAGLARLTRRGTLIDTFRDRITIGVCDVPGNLVGFLGRAGPGASPRTPKYLNTPHTAAYHKASTLFGLHEQSARLRDGATPVIVEGPLDVLAIASLQDRSIASVSSCGTALTVGQVALLAHTASPTKVLVAFDADPAGGLGALRAYGVLGRYFHSVGAVRLPAGADPASSLTLPDGLRRLRDAIHQPHPLADELTDAAIAPWAAELDNAEARVAALRSAAAAIAATAGPDYARQAARLIRLLQFDAGTVTREITTAVTDHQQHRRRAVGRSSNFSANLARRTTLNTLTGRSSDRAVASTPSSLT